MKEKWRETIFYFIFALAAFFLFRDGLLPGKVIFAYDILTIDLPFRMFADLMFHKYGQMPLWLPHIFSGMPMIESSNLSYFYPLDFLFMLLRVPVYYAYTPEMIIHLFVAAAGMYLFLKRFGIQRHAAAFGAFVFMTSGALVSLMYAGQMHNIHAISLIPFVFYFIKRGVDEQRFFYFLSAALVFALQIIGIGMQVMAYTYAAAAAYVLFEVFTNKQMRAGERARIAAYFTAATLMITLFSAVQFFPSLGYVKLTWRNDISYETFTWASFNPLYTMTFFLPQFFGLKDDTFWGYAPNYNFYTFYMGLIPFFALPFLAGIREKRKHVLFFAAGAVVFLLLSFGGYTPWYKLLLHFPVFNNFRNPSRFLCLFTFNMAVLAAFAVNRLGLNAEEKNGNKNPQMIIWLITTGVLAFASAVFIAAAYSRPFIRFISDSFAASSGHGSGRSTLLELIKMIKQDALAFALVAVIFSCITLAAVKNKIKSVFVIALLLCVTQFMDTYRIENKFINYREIKRVILPENPATSLLLGDKGIFRIIDLDKRSLPNKNIFYGLESLAGYHGNNPSKTFVFTAPDLSKDLNLYRMWNVKYYISRYDIKGKGLERILDGAVKVYRDNRAAPRFYMVYRIKKAGSETEAYNYIKSPDFSMAEAVAPEDKTFLTAAVKNDYNIKAELYSPNRIELEVETGAKGMLVASNSYNEQWKAEVDGKPVEIHCVNFCMTGVLIPAGRHKVTLKYDIIHMGWYMAATIIAALFYAAMWFFERKYYRKKEEPRRN